ncbi:MAG: hypothetical protein E7304_05840 [Butyrivibrio sp.]|uniref:hypothetical protein n=1 Tax=Butyrivibrio sp. TaxID=28121 RepID=UPI001EC65194|nr:hypothetical protein [Butyrivibrio sp.]MBE5840912.1 hypothetical protein [Butyrivibrio sp.]
MNELEKALDCFYGTLNKKRDSADDFCLATVDIQNNIKDIDDEELLKLVDSGFDCVNSGLDDTITCFAISTAINIISTLIDRKNTESVKKLTLFFRDDYFKIYLKNKTIYYRIANYFYYTVVGEYPELNKEGYRDVRNMAKGMPDSGFMDMDYIYMAAWASYRGIMMHDAGCDVKESDYKLYLKMYDMYIDFHDFADQGYGVETYNHPKEKKLYNECIKNYRDAEKDDPFFDKPIWASLAYATAEAGAQYFERCKIAQMFGLEEFCDKPYPIEKSKLDSLKKGRIIRIVLLAVVVAIALFIVKTYAAHPYIYGGIIVFVLCVIVTSITRNGKGSIIGYSGHHYVGRAYWIKNNY